MCSQRQQSLLQRPHVFQLLRPLCQVKGFPKEGHWPFHFRFFYKAYFCKSERRSLEKGATTGEPQLNGTPVSFGNVLQAGGKCSKEDNSTDKTSTEEESTEDSILPTKEKETPEITEEGKGVNLTEEKHPSELSDDNTDAVSANKGPNTAEDKKENNFITDPKKLNSPQIVNGTEEVQQDKGTIGAAQVAVDATPSEDDTNRTSEQTEIFDQNPAGSNDSDTESKKDKWRGYNFDQDNKISRWTSLQLLIIQFIDLPHTKSL